jgi:hypothetical protein
MTEWISLQAPFSREVAKWVDTANLVWGKDIILDSVFIHSNGMRRWFIADHNNAMMFKLAWGGK